MRRIRRFIYMVIAVLVVAVVLLSRPANSQLVADKLPPHMAGSIQKVQEVSQAVGGALPNVDQTTIQGTKENAGDVAEHAQEIFNSSVQGTDEKPPLHQRAIEYGQYQYCLQVVQEYEKTYEVE